MASRTYGQLIRENRDFRQLWIAAVISMLGEWFNTIALFFLSWNTPGVNFFSACSSRSEWLVSPSSNPSLVCSQTGTTGRP